MSFNGETQDSPTFERSIRVQRELVGVELGITTADLSKILGWQLFGLAQGTPFDSGVPGEILYIYGNPLGDSKDSLAICGAISGLVYKVGVMSESINASEFIAKKKEEIGNPHIDRDSTGVFYVWEDDRTVLELSSTPMGTHIMLTDRSLLLGAYK